MEAFPDMVQDLLGEITVDLLRLLEDGNQRPLLALVLLEDLIKPAQIDVVLACFLLFNKNIMKYEK